MYVFRSLARCRCACTCCVCVCVCVCLCVYMCVSIPLRSAGGFVFDTQHHTQRIGAVDRWIGNNQVLRGFVEGFVPTLLINVFILTLPAIIRGMDDVIVLVSCV